MQMSAKVSASAPDNPAGSPPARAASLTLRGAEARIERWSKKAPLFAIIEFENSARVAPFTVPRSDFLSVLNTVNGSPKQLEEHTALPNASGVRAPLRRGCAHEGRI
jgi:hypothetical protein